MATANTSELVMKELRKKRGSLKCRLTHFGKYVNSFKGVQLTAHQRAELKLRVVGSQSLMNDFNHVQTQIEDISPESEIERQLQSRENFEREYYNILALAECLTVSDERSESSAPSNNAIKLPAISIPCFDGSYEHWLEFRDTFLSLVHNCDSITPIQKFHYLKSALKYNAKSVIDSLEFSADNYEVAWELIINRFDNTKLLVHNHIKSIFSIQTLQKESPGQLRKLIDTILKNIRALKLLNEPVQHWDSLIIYIIVTKLDLTTEREWEEYKCTVFQNKGSHTNLKLDDLLQFLRNRADILETLIVSHTKSSVHSTTDTKKQTHSRLLSTPKVHCNVATNKISHKNNSQTRMYKLCSLCNEQHALYTCHKFLNLSVKDRLEFIHNKHLCINCMRAGHNVDNCVFGPCRKCDKKHNSLLCETISLNECKPSAVTLTSYEMSNGTATQLSKIHPHSTAQMNQLKSILLPTAIVKIRGQSGGCTHARAVLDSASERSFITQSLRDKIKPKIIQSTFKIHGVGNSATQCIESCFVELKSRISSYKVNVQCLILPQITSNLPISSISIDNFNIPENIVLADPSFYDSQPIDMLIGADLFWELIQEGKMRLNNGPFIQNTHFGWIVSGSIPLISHKQLTHVNCNLIQSDDENSMTSLKQLLRKFWEIEELPNNSIHDIGSGEELACEEYFIKTTRREPNGRFVVRFPLKHSATSLGETRSQAERRFYTLEKRLERNPTYKKLYSDFIHEYISLGHMSLVETYSTPHYFLPHLGVFREHATSTKLRVVFDGGMKSSTGLSLNDLQMVGPGIQGDLIAILLRFRENRYVACADITQFYRQVYIEKDQRDLQLILWRDNPCQPLQVYQLNTVTYGTASAPFLSCRCLKELGEKCEVPYVKENINNSFYVDDMICGANSISELIKICDGTDQVLKSGCFVLRKWVFNFDRTNPNDALHIVTKEIALGECTQNKTLGIGWNNKSDEIMFYSKIKNTSENTITTKRCILSGTSQIYDPLGLLSPIITIAKTLLQKCWLLNLEWDEPVPRDIARVWNHFVNDLLSLNSLRIPRYTMCINASVTEIHIFTDASQIAYGACAYIRTIDNNATVTVHLLCSKSKVCPIKPTTMPRLELCGAVIGARLYTKIIQSLRSKFSKVVFWTDSTIVLGWLGMPINVLKPYVQNRTSEIHSLTTDHQWRHVSGKQNPADLVSRGQRLDALSTSSLWWNGPSFLHDVNFELPDLTNINYSIDALPEIKSTVSCHVANQSDDLFPFSRFSHYGKIKRSAAYMLRFIHNARYKNNRRTGLLSMDELNSSELLLAKLSQQESFPDEYESFLKNKSIKLRAHLLKLNLFFDSNHNVLRVGGRIQNSPDFCFNKCHPILLNSKHHFTILLFQYEHKRLLHGAPQLLLYSIRESWWPIGGRYLAKKVFHTCIKCARLHASTVKPIMGNLPKERLLPGFPFLRCGVDYLGPVFILNRKGKGARLQKAYVCLFICFASRAVHLELVTDLSSDAYLSALKRFISRRGKPSEIHSDNGRNFVGVKNEFTQFLKSCSDEIKEYAMSQNIKFKMIPSYASHFGGLWEAGVKSCKYHLKRVVGNAHLTFEEFSTVLAQVEAVLNSRPLSPMSTDPHDFMPLTPSHFLVGRPLTAPVSADLQDVPASRLSRYQRVEQIRQHFWNRWAKEYVSEMQTRCKWLQHKGDLKENTLVLIKEENLPPLKWSLGRIIKTHPGKDGISRVADIQKADGIVRRAFSKICPLPSHEE